MNHTNRDKYDWRQPNRLLVVQTGDSIEQDKVCKAHEVPHNFCANLINASKLLANQQEDGDGLLQNIVKNLGKESRKGLTNGLREFIKVDNERALDVGALRRGTGTLEVRKPKAPEGSSDVTIRESPDDIEGGRSQHFEGLHGKCRSTLNKKDGVLPWSMLTGMPSARRCTKASKEKIGKKFTFRTKK